MPALRSGDQGTVVLDRTPFYAEAGGQVGDKGELIGSGGTFQVADTQKIQADVYGHHGALKTGTLKVGDKVEARVDTARARTMRNHSVTHIMQGAARGARTARAAEGLAGRPGQDALRLLARQAGERSGAARGRAPRQCRDPRNTPTRAEVMPIEQAKKSGAVMLFGEKYGDEVRVLDIGSSREFCGGTHVARTGDIGLFKIYSEGGVAAGIRRIEATTGSTALAMVDRQLQELAQVANRSAPSPGRWRRR